jgi:L,D-transpeptidase catalytic domain
MLINLVKSRSDMKRQLSIKNAERIRKSILGFLILLAGGASIYLLLVRLGYLMPLSEFQSVVSKSSSEYKKSFHPTIKVEMLKKEKELNHGKLLPVILGDNVLKEKISILIEKSEYRLTIFYKLQPIKSYPVVFGGNPKGQKLHEGDQKTPEGIYHIRSFYDHPNWSKFLWLDYPTPQSWREHSQAKRSGKLNWALPIGGEVGIHGVPIGRDNLIDRRTNWTWGCISLKNVDVVEISNFVRVGTLVEIVP